MSYKAENIKLIVEEILKDASDDFHDKDIFITNVKISSDSRITVLIDSFNNVKIADCALLSKKIEEQLDRENEDFELVVSSAGLDNPFTVLKQYQKNIGRIVKILLKDGEKIKGKLISVNEDEVELELERKNKKSAKKTAEIQENLKVKFNHIKETKIVVTF